MIFDKKHNIDFIEFLLVFVIFIIPPIFNITNPELMPKPTAISGYFLFKIILQAGYEEILYRIYLPYSIKKILPGNTDFLIIEITPVILFSLAHIYLGIFNTIYAFFAGCLFRLLYLFLKNKTNNITACIIITLIHSFNNIYSYAVLYFYK